MFFTCASSGKIKCTFFPTSEFLECHWNAKEELPRKLPRPGEHQSSKVDFGKRISGFVSGSICMEMKDFVDSGQCEGQFRVWSEAVTGVNAMDLKSV